MFEKFQSKRTEKALDKGTVCDKCNNYFTVKIEGQVLNLRRGTKSIWVTNPIGLDYNCKPPMMPVLTKQARHFSRINS